MFFKLAFRNIWRNKGRTMITIASIFFAVLFSSFMNAFQKGTWDRMLDNVVNFYYGYAQVHKKGYWADQSINRSMEFTQALDSLKYRVADLEESAPRLESFALASFDTQTSGMLVIGTDPERENILTRLGEKIVEGEYFHREDRSVLIAEGVKTYLGMELGDTIILISQGYHGVNSAGKYPVKGIVKFASPELNKKMVFLPLNEAQYFFGAPGRLTSLALKMESRDQLPGVLRGLRKELDTEEYEIMDWKEMIPELVEAQQSDAAGNYIMLIVLYVLITFGIFGTILMMTKEREYEFGILISIGMKRKQLALVTWLEVVILGLIGALAGILGCIPLVYYFHVNPIDLSAMGGENMMGVYEKWGFDPLMPAAFEFDLFFYQAVIVFILTSLLATYAIWHIYRLRPMEAIRAT